MQVVHGVVHTNLFFCARNKYDGIHNIDEGCMQQYKYLHELSDSEFSRLVTIIEDHESMKWLSSGHGNSGWNRARLSELREYSRMDSRNSFRARTRKYHYWAILFEGSVAGMFGIHPVPMCVTEAILLENGGMGMPVRSQFMFVVAPRFRGRGIATRAINDMTREYPNVCIVIREDNVAALHMMSSVRTFARISQNTSIDGTDVVVYQPIYGYTV